MAYNLLADNPHYFDFPAGRTEFCRQWRFLPVYDKLSYPARDFAARPATQFFCAAEYRPGLAIDPARMPGRRLENLRPSALVYEADGVDINGQLTNVPEESEEYFLSVTYSGGKSIHLVVPLPVAVGDGIIASADPRTLYKLVWQRVAARLFRDPTILDESCASIGRLTRMPGATRYASGPDGHIDRDKPVKRQVPIHYNPRVTLLDYAPIVRECGAEFRAAVRRAAPTVATVLRSCHKPDYALELDHLEHSAGKYPTTYKRLALQVLGSSAADPIPSERELKEGHSHVGCARYLLGHFPALAPVYYAKVQGQHPTNLPLAYDEWLRHVPASERRA